jgi:hypothetical protein
VKPLAQMPWETSPLGAWKPTRSAARPAEPARRLVILHGCPNAEGEPRGGIVQPGRPTIAFHNLQAAAAALRQMEQRA